jgi:hypothetical protein
VILFSMRRKQQTLSYSVFHCKLPLRKGYPRARWSHEKIGHKKRFAHKAWKPGTILAR